MKNTFSVPLNYKDIFINNIYFRIIYEKTEKTKKDYKSLRFVDHLFTFNSKSNLNEIYKNNNINNYRIEERNYIK